jgi:uncharacterized membrane protein YidH (DUF202 family)
VTAAAGQDSRGDDPQERAPGLARERTSLAWTRTAISFAALGGVVLRANVVTGLIILAIAPAVWRLGYVTRGGAERTDPSAIGQVRLLLITASIVLITLLCLAIAVFGKADPGALRSLSH